MAKKIKIMPKEERPVIEVSTHNNGYGMDVNGDGYMYFSVRDLVMGIIQHSATHLTRTEQNMFLEALKNGESPAHVWASKYDELSAVHQNTLKKNNELRLEIYSLQREADKRVGTDGLIDFA